MNFGLHCFEIKLLLHNTLFSQFRPCLEALWKELIIRPLGGIAEHGLLSLIIPIEDNSWLWSDEKSTHSITKRITGDTIVSINI